MIKLFKPHAPFIVWFSFALVMSILIAPALLNRSINADIFWQRWLGTEILATHRIPTLLGRETVSAPGAPWVPHEWLLGLALALAQRAHANVVLAAASIGAVAATMVLGATRTRRRRSRHPLFIALCVTLIGLSTIESFGIRAQTFAWPLFALLLLLLDDGGMIVWWSIPLTAMWSNVHASVMLAPITALLYALGALLDEREWTPRATRFAVLVPLLLLATCANPLGWRMPLYAIALQRSPVNAYITEWQPSGSSDSALWFSMVPIGIGLAALVWRGRRLASIDILVTLACAYLAFSAGRNIPIFSIAAAPIVCAAVERMFSLRISPAESPMERALQALAALVVLSGICWFSFFHLTVAYARGGLLLPVDAIDHIAAISGPKRLFCYDFAACSLALGHSNLRTFMDGRCDPFPWPVWERYLTVVQVKRGWERVLDEYRITFVLAPDGTLLTRSMSANHKWQRIYHQDRSTVFARKPNPMIIPARFPFPRGRVTVFSRPKNTTM